MITNFTNYYKATEIKKIGLAEDQCKPMEKKYRSEKKLWMNGKKYMIYIHTQYTCIIHVWVLYICACVYEIN